jgi:hypothetical protein
VRRRLRRWLLYLNRLLRRTLNYRLLRRLLRLMLRLHRLRWLLHLRRRHEAAVPDAARAAAVPALPDAQAAAPDARKAADTGAAAPDEGFMLPMHAIRGVIDPMNANFTHAFNIVIKVVVLRLFVIARLHTFQWAIAKHRGTFFTAGPETMYQ